MRSSPSYTLEAGTFDATFYVGATFVGDRFGDNANTNELPGYEKIDGRPIFGRSFMFSVRYEGPRNEGLPR